MKITSVVPVSEFTRDEYLVMLTRGGYIKKTELAAFSNIRANGLVLFPWRRAQMDATRQG